MKTTKTHLSQAKRDQKKYSSIRLDLDVLAAQIKNEALPFSMSKLNEKTVREAIGILDSFLSDCGRQIESCIDDLEADVKILGNK